MDASERRRRASEEAANWFVRLQAHDLSRSSREQYVDWLRDSPTNVAEMLRVAQAHCALEQFEHWARIATDGPEADSNVIPMHAATPLTAQDGEVPGQRPRKGVWVTALAASVAVIALATAILLSGIRGQIIDTERGERREVVLSDGSIVQVDPQTRMRVKFEAHSRRVFLERGRALFRVAKNPNRPFLVEVDDTVVRAVGTAFGVERQREDVVVTVSEGKVAVVSSNLARESAPSQRGSGVSGVLQSERGAATNPSVRSAEAGAVPREGEVFLTAGQQLTVQSSGSAELLRKVDSTRELAWAEGRLIFENDRVTEVIKEFNRYNRVQLHVTDPTLAARPVSGVFSASDPESFIAFIQTVAPVLVVRSDDQDITLSPRHLQQ